MVNGTVDGVKQSPVTKKGRYKTWYRLHPNQENLDYFGHVMICHNLPVGAFVVNGGDKMSVSEMYRKKGFTETPQELNPNADVVRDSKGGFYIVPKGYELKETAGKTLFGDGKSYVDGIAVRIVRKETVDKVLTGEMHVCDICGKECKTKLALAGHKRSHAK